MLRVVIIILLAFFVTIPAIAQTTTDAIPPVLEQEKNEQVVVPTPMPDANAEAVPTIIPVPQEGAVQSAEQAQAALVSPAPAPVDEVVKAMAYAYKYYSEGNLNQALEKLKEAQTQVSAKISPMPLDAPTIAENPAPLEGVPTVPTTP